MPTRRNAGADGLSATDRVTDLFARYEPAAQSLRLKLPLGPRLDNSTAAELSGLAVWIFASGFHRFAEWRMRMYDDVDASAAQHLLHAWSQVPILVRERFKAATDDGISSVQRCDYALKCKDLTEAWSAAEVERTEVGGLLHDHVCPECGSERGDDDMNCVLGSRIQCAKCQAKERFGHEHHCPNCSRRWDCQSSGCIDEPRMKCGDCLGSRRFTSKSRPKFSTLFLLSGISTTLVLIGFVRMPYGFYGALRIALCITAVAAMSATTGRSPWPWVFASTALLYNPLLPVHLHDKAVWEILNVLAVGLFWFAVFRLESAREK